MGQILQGVFIMGPNGGPAIHIEAAVAPGESKTASDFDQKETVYPIAQLLKQTLKDI